MATRKQIRLVTDAHINAKISGKYDNPLVMSKEDIVREMLNGKTFSAVINQIESRFISITSQLMSSQFGHVSNTYRTQVYNAIKTLLS